MTFDNLSTGGSIFLQDLDDVDVDESPGQKEDLTNGVSCCTKTSESLLVMVLKGEGCSCIFTLDRTQTSLTR